MAKTRLEQRRLTRMVALLRGINVGGQRKVPMAALRTLAAGAGFAGVETYIQSGNLTFTASASTAEVEAELERAMKRRFGFAVDVIARTASEWAGYIASNPFPDAAEERPQHLLLSLSKRTPNDNAATRLRARATLGERIELRGDALWLDYAGGVGRSKLTPAVLDKAVGSAVTARNWTTVLKLAEMLGQATSDPT